MAEINQQNRDIPQLVMTYELGTRAVHVYRGSLCERYVLAWDGYEIKAIECICPEQAFEVFGRCLGEPMGEA